MGMGKPATQMRRAKTFRSSQAQERSALCQARQAVETGAAVRLNDLFDYGSGWWYRAKECDTATTTVRPRYHAEKIVTGPGQYYLTPGAEGI